MYKILPSAYTAESIPQPHYLKCKHLCYMWLELWARPSSKYSSDCSFITSSEGSGSLSFEESDHSGCPWCWIWWVRFKYLRLFIWTRAQVISPPRQVKSIILTGVEMLLSISSSFWLLDQCPSCWVPQQSTCWESTWMCGRVENRSKGLVGIRKLKTHCVIKNPVELVTSVQGSG